MENHTLTTSAEQLFLFTKNAHYKYKSDEFINSKTEFYDTFLNDGFTSTFAPLKHITQSIFPWPPIGGGRGAKKKHSKRILKYLIISDKNYDFRDFNQFKI